MVRNVDVETSLRIFLPKDLLRFVKNSPSPKMCFSQISRLFLYFQSLINRSICAMSTRLPMLQQLLRSNFSPIRRETVFTLTQRERFSKYLKLIPRSPLGIFQKPHPNCRAILKNIQRALGVILNLLRKLFCH